MICRPSLRKVTIRYFPATMGGQQQAIAPPHNMNPKEFLTHLLVGGLLCKSDSITLASKLGTSVAHSLVILVLTVTHAGDPNRQHLL